MSTRRQFLLSTVALAAAQKRMDASSDWDLVRRQFPYEETRVPMNAGNLCPSPRVVSERVYELTRDIDRDVSYTNRAKLAELTERSRERVAEHLGADADEIALVRNTSEANATVIGGLSLGPSDEVLLWEENHPTNNVAWDVRAEKERFTVRRIATARDGESPDALAQPFLDALGSRTRVLAVSHVSNYSGVRLPVERLAEAARARGIFVLVDGAQSYGALAIDVRRLDCDAFTASTHKWLCGPKEAGVLYLARERTDDVAAHTVGFGWSDRHASGELGARKLETLGQRDDACLAAISTAVDFHHALGVDRVEARVLALAGLLKKRLRDAGLPLLTPTSPATSSGVVTVRVPPQRRRELVHALDAGGFAASPAGGLRICPHVYNTEEQVERAAKVVASLVR